MNSPKVIKSYEVQPNRKLLFISLSFALILSILPWLAPSVSADTGNGSCAQAPNFTKDIGFGSQVAFTTARQPQGIVMHDLSAAPAQGLVPQSVYNHPTWDDWGDTGKITLDKDGYVYAAPQPWQSLLDNPPSAARKILRVDTDTGVMTEWLSLPATAHPPTTANPYAVLGLAYDCENHMLYVADISGSTDVAVNGQIYAIDIATATVVDTFDDVDALGLGVSDVSGTKKLYYGDGHTNKIRSINLDAAGNFTGAAVDEITVPQTNMRAGDITFQPDGKMLFPESQFSFNLSGWGYHAQDSYRYEYVNGAWSQDIQVAPGQPNHPRSSMPGAEYDPVNEFFWFTSNAVHFPTPYIYGASGFAAGDSLLNNADATYLDYTTVNNNIKAYLGDIQMAHRFMTLGNYVWVDSNADGLQTPGEAPVPGVTLYLYLDGSSTTNSINSSTNPLPVWLRVTTLFRLYRRLAIRIRVMPILLVQIQTTMCQTTPTL